MAGKREVKKAQYYVYYMGWKECIGLHGRRYTDPVVRELVQIHSRHPFAVLNKLTVQLSSRDIKITQEVDKGKGKTVKTKLPGIPAKDVAYAAQGPVPDDDTVATIFLGYNPQTNCAVHVHVYRCDSAETASIMTAHFQQIVEAPEHKIRMAKIEKELMDSGHIEPASSQREELPSKIPSPSAFRSVADELKSRLSNTDEAPILLPPIDYDTMSRAQGKIHLRHHRKSLQYDSIAPGGVFIRKVDDHVVEDESVRRSSSHSSSGGSDREPPVALRTRPSVDQGFFSNDRKLNGELDRRSYGSDRDAFDMHQSPGRRISQDQHQSQGRRISQDQHQSPGRRISQDQHQSPGRRTSQDPHQTPNRRVSQDPPDRRVSQQESKEVEARRLRRPDNENNARRSVGNQQYGY